MCGCLDIYYSITAKQLNGFGEVFILLDHVLDIYVEYYMFAHWELLRLLNDYKYSSRD